MELRSDGQTDSPADRLKFYQAVQSRSSLFTTLQDSILIFSLEEDVVCIHVPWDDGLACTLAHDIFVEQSDGDDDDDDDDDDDGGRSEEHTSELQSLMRISYAVFCLKKKKNKHQ